MNVQNRNYEKKFQKNSSSGGVLTAVIVQAVLILFIMIALGRFIYMIIFYKTVEIHIFFLQFHIVF